MPADISKPIWRLNPSESTYRVQHASWENPMPTVRDLAKKIDKAGNGDENIALSEIQAFRAQPKAEMDALAADFGGDPTTAPRGSPTQLRSVTLKAALDTADRVEDALRASQGRSLTQDLFETRKRNVLDAAYLTKWAPIAILKKILFF